MGFTSTVARLFRSKGVRRTFESETLRLPAAQQGPILRFFFDGSLEVHESGTFVDVKSVARRLKIEPPSAVIRASILNGMLRRLAVAAAKGE